MRQFWHCRWHPRLYCSAWERWRQAPAWSWWPGSCRWRSPSWSQSSLRGAVPGKVWSTWPRHWWCWEVVTLHWLEPSQELKCEDLCLKVLTKFKVLPSSFVSNNRKLEGLDKALLENGTMKTEYSVLGFKWFRTCERAAAPDIVRVWTVFSSFSKDPTCSSWMW